MTKTQKNKANSIATISGVDALYYQQSVLIDDYIIFYNNCTLNKSFSFGNFERISQDWNKQYTYFELFGKERKQIAKIGFKNLNTRDGLEYVSVQMSSYYMNLHGIEESYREVSKSLEDLGLRLLNTKVSRIDLNSYVYGHDFTYLEYYRFSTLIRSNSKFYSGKKDKLTTFYLGKRSNGSSPFMRIYDKWQELFDVDTEGEKQALIRYKFKKELDIDLNENIPLWNVEFELKRELLKANGINTVQQFLQSANKLHALMMQRIRLLNKKRIDGDKNTDRIPTAKVWQIIEKNYNFQDSNVELEKIIPIRYSKDIKWLLNRLREYKKEQTDSLSDNAILLALSQELNTIQEEKRQTQPK